MAQHLFEKKPERIVLYIKFSWDQLSPVVVSCGSGGCLLGEFGIDRSCFDNASEEKIKAISLFQFWARVSSREVSKASELLSFNCEWMEEIKR